MATMASDEELLKEVCGMNGIVYAKIALNAVDDVKKIEVLFSPFCKISTLHPFVSLTHLHILKCDVTTFDGLQFLSNLQELYVIECSIRRMEFLENCVRLQSLYLYENQISKIEGLNRLVDLEVLWLNSNQLKTLDGLRELKELRDLNLADNVIAEIGNSLDQLTNLEVIDLSANQLTSFKDLTSLARLPKLKALSLKNPAWGPNPVCLLCNCTTHILYHMPSLTLLDTQMVTSESVREVESIVLKKKMYYNMRVKTVNRTMAELLLQLESEAKKMLVVPVKKLLAMKRLLRSVERELMDTTDTSLEETNSCPTSSVALSEILSTDTKNSSTQLTSVLKQRITELKSSISKWTTRLKQLEFEKLDFQQRIKAVATGSIQRLVSELESGGNVRFEDGLPSDPWFSSCRDLVMSRFCASSLVQFDIQGIRVQRITRLHNRMLRLKFDEKFEQMADDTQTRSGAQFKKKLEYLFYVWNPKLHKSCKDVVELYEQGLPSLDVFVTNNLAPAIPMTNCVSIADKQRLHKLKEASSHRLCDQEDAMHAQLLVCRVYLGRTVLTHDTSRLSRENFPNVDSVYNPVMAASNSNWSTGRGVSNNSEVAAGKFGTGSAEKEPNTEDNKDTISGSSGLPTAEQTGCNSQTTINGTGGVSGADCDCVTRQCNWYIFERDLVVPEYIVDYRYSFRSKPTSPFINLPDGLVQLSATANQQSLSTLRARPKDDREELDEKFSDDLESMTTNLLPKRMSFTSVSEDNLIKFTGQTNLSALTVLNLHNCGVNRAKAIPALPNLKKLIISFNELVRVEDFGKLSSLEHLDVCANKLNTLEGIKNLTNLKYLDISWNELCNSRDDVAILRKHAPNIEQLRMEHNSWRKAENLRVRVIGRLKLLKKLDGTPVTDLEIAAANRAATNARVSPTSLISNGRTDAHRPRSLSLDPYSQILYLTSKRRPERTSELDSLWLTKITCLYLDSQHLSKISNLERLENLKFASFRDNDITKIEGLDSCVNLEELCLDNNCISKIEGLSKLVKLKRLSLSNNVITQVDTLSTYALTSLYYLSVESNRINSLLPFHKNTTLMELYLGNNEIANIREVFHLKAFNNLVILDLFGNPIVSSSPQNYRLFVVYHLKSLKALDGMAISLGDLNQAREFFGGKLTVDFVADKLRVNDFTQVRELDFPNCAIRYVDLGRSSMFTSLRSLNLEHNSLTSFSGLIYLDNLQVLCLNYNRIETTVLDPKTTAKRATKDGVVGSKLDVARGGVELECGSIESLTRYNILPKLEVLHLGYNSISDIASLQLDRVPSIRSLFLQGNEITEIDGLHALTSLRDLVLDRNKIKSVGPNSFIRNDMLVELHLEENRLRELSHLHVLHNLQRLYLANNRLQDMSELDRLENLSNLVEVNLTNNAISRRLLHRPLLVFRQPNLEIIDGIAVTDEERQKADMYFLDQQQQQAPQSFQQPTGYNNSASTIPQIQMTDILPGIKSSVSAGIGGVSSSPIKVTSVPIGTSNAPGQHIIVDDNSGTAAIMRSKQRTMGQIAPANGGTGSSQFAALPGQRSTGTINMTTNARLYRRFFNTPPK